MRMFAAVALILLSAPSEPQSIVSFVSDPTSMVKSQVGPGSNDDTRTLSSPEPVSTTICALVIDPVETRTWVVPSPVSPGAEIGSAPLSMTMSPRSVLSVRSSSAPAPSSVIFSTPALTATSAARTRRRSICSNCNRRRARALMRLFARLRLPKNRFIGTSRTTWWTRRAHPSSGDGRHLQVHKPNPYRRLFARDDALTGIRAEGCEYQIAPRDLPNHPIIGPPGYGSGGPL